MSRPDKIELRCGIVPLDKVECQWQPDPDDHTVLAVRMYRREQHQLGVYLKPEQARELFAWLGAKLHTGATDGKG